MARNEHDGGVTYPPVDCVDARGRSYGTLQVDHGEIGRGGFKIIDGMRFNLVLPSVTSSGKQKIVLGGAGLPVIATPRLHGPNKPIDVFNTFDDEVRWLEHLESLDSADSPIARRRGEQKGFYEFQQDGIAFGQSLEDTIETIAHAPETLLPPQYKELLLLSYVTRATKALERFHEMTFDLGNGPTRLIHGDIGQYNHLGNFVSPARGGRTYIIDYSHLQPATTARQDAEKTIFSNQIGEALSYNKALNLFPAEVVEAMRERRLNRLDGNTLELYLTAKLREIRETQGFDFHQILNVAKERYFWAYLDWKIKKDAGVTMPEEGITVVAKSIEDFYHDAPTMSLNRSQLLPPTR